MRFPGKITAFRFRSKNKLLWMVMQEMQRHVCAVAQPLGAMYVCDQKITKIYHKHLLWKKPTSSLNFNLLALYLQIFVKYSQSQKWMSHSSVPVDLYCLNTLTPTLNKCPSFPHSGETARNHHQLHWWHWPYLTLIWLLFFIELPVFQPTTKLRIAFDGSDLIWPYLTLIWYLFFPIIFSCLLVPNSD